MSGSGYERGGRGAERGGQSGKPRSKNGFEEQERGTVSSQPNWKLFIPEPVQEGPMAEGELLLWKLLIEQLSIFNGAKKKK